MKASQRMYYFNTMVQAFSLTKYHSVSTLLLNDCIVIYGKKKLMDFVTSKGNP